MKKGIPVILYCVKEFKKGPLKGMKVTDSISFVSEDRANKWIEGIKKNEPYLNYNLVGWELEER